MDKYNGIELYKIYKEICEYLEYLKIELEKLKKEQGD